MFVIPKVFGTLFWVLKQFPLLSSIMVLCGLARWLYEKWMQAYIWKLQITSVINDCWYNIIEAARNWEDSF